MDNVVRMGGPQQALKGQAQSQVCEFSRLTRAPFLDMAPSEKLLEMEDMENRRDNRDDIKGRHECADNRGRAS